MKNQKGMTLIELIIVIAIIGIIAVIGISSFVNVQEDAREDADRSVGRQIERATEVYLAENPNTDKIEDGELDIQVLKDEDLIEENIVLQSSKYKGTIVIEVDENKDVSVKLNDIEI